MNTINAQVTDTKRSRNVQSALPRIPGKKKPPGQGGFLNIGKLTVIKNDISDFRLVITYLKPRIIWCRRDESNTRPSHYE